MGFQRTLTIPAWNSEDRDSQQGLAFLITVILLAGLYAGLRWIDLPEKRIDTAQYEEIDWTKFTPIPPSATKEERAQSTAEEAPVAPTPKRIERIDLADIVAFFEDAGGEDQPAVQSPVNPLGVAPMEPQVREQLEIPDISSLLITPTSPEAPSFEIPTRVPGVERSGQEKPTLEVRRGSELDLQEIEYESGKESTGVRKPVGVEAPTPTVTMINAADLGEEYENLSSILDDLVQWMRDHPAEFSDVVKRFVGFASGDLTSMARFRIGARDFELYLLYRDTERELRICLVEGEQSIFLIDRGLRERSHYLRAGKVGRGSTGQITYFETSQDSPSDARTAEFYRLFLSWWEGQRHE
jgi:hypothetical protein